MNIWFGLLLWGCWLCAIHSRSLQTQGYSRGQLHHPALGPYKGKIAFMFLARGDLPHEDLWEVFFSFHAPPSFYSIYWHTQPDYKPSNHSFFRPYQLKHLIPTQWGTMSLVEASRNLIREALNDPENQYFALFSESCIPLVPFTVWYRGMMQYANKYSLVNACDFGANNMETPTRWRPELDTVPGFSPEKFRKSAQWVALNRKHAALVANDVLLAPKFQNVKPSDEHYVASLLAMHNLDNETTCGDGFTHVVWPDLRSAHPATYSPDYLGSFHPPSASFLAVEKIVPLLVSSTADEEGHRGSSSSSGSSSGSGSGSGNGRDRRRVTTVELANQRRELLSMWREYDKHRDVFAHLRNTFTTFDVFNGRCAFHALSEAEQTILLPHGAQWATSWAVEDIQRRGVGGRVVGGGGGSGDIIPDYVKHVDIDTLVNNTRAFAQFVVSRGLLPLSQVPEPLRSQLVPFPVRHNNGGAPNVTVHHGSGMVTALLTETLPCHFSGRKFAPTARWQLLSMVDQFLRDDAFQLVMTPYDAFNRTVHRRLRYHRDPRTGETKVFLIDHRHLLYVPDVRFLLFPLPSSVTQSSSSEATMMAYLSTVLPPLTAEEEAEYGGVANAGAMFTLPEGTTVKLQRDATVYLIQNFTRRVIPDFDTFLAMGLSPHQIRVIGPEEMQQIVVGPMLPHKESRRKRRMSSSLSSTSNHLRKASPWLSWEATARQWLQAHHGLFL